jgi:hypothetical protein
LRSDRVSIQQFGSGEQAIEAVAQVIIAADHRQEPRIARIERVIGKLLCVEGDRRPLLRVCERCGAASRSSVLRDAPPVQAWGKRAELVSRSFYDHDGVCRAGEFVWHHIGSFHQTHSDEGAVILEIYRKPNVFQHGAGYARKAAQ